MVMTPAFFAMAEISAKALSVSSMGVMMISSTTALLNELCSVIFLILKCGLHAKAVYSVCGDIVLFNELCHSVKFAYVFR